MFGLNFENQLVDLLLFTASHARRGELSGVITVGPVGPVSTSFHFE